jgi:hypothetical protein
MGLHLLLTRQLSIVQAVVHGLVRARDVIAQRFARARCESTRLPPCCLNALRAIAGRARCVDCADRASRFLPVGQAVVAGALALCDDLLCVAASDTLARQELEVLRFNVLDNRSSEWGTSAFHWCALAFLFVNGWLPLTPFNRQVLLVSPAARAARGGAAGGAWRGSGTPAAAAVCQRAGVRVALLSATAQGAHTRWRRCIPQWLA